MFGFGLSKALCEKGAFDLSLMFVRNVVGQFIVREGGIEASDRARDRIVPATGRFTIGWSTQCAFRICTSVFMILCRSADKKVMSNDRASRARCPQEAPMLLHSPQYIALYSVASLP